MSEEDQTIEHAPAPRDRVTTWLVYGALTAALAVFALLAYVVYASISGPGAPRTSAERDIMTLETIVAQNPNSPRAWGDYIKALILAEQYGKARTTIDEAQSNVGTATAVLVEEARLLEVRGRTDEALAALDKTVAQAREQYDTEVRSRLARGLSARPEPRDLVAALILRAEVLGELGRWDDAIGSYSEALELDPTMADVMTDRGLAKLEKGDATGAVADFEAALEFIPDYQPALDGLRRAKGGEGR